MLIYCQPDNDMSPLYPTGESKLLKHKQEEQYVSDAIANHVFKVELLTNSIYGMYFHIALSYAAITM